MTRYFTQYWRNDTWDRNFHDGHQGSLLDHTADNGFRKRHAVAAGDYVYIVTIRNGKLHLLCRGTIDRVTNQRGAAIALGTSANMLWEAADHILFRAEEAAREDYKREVPNTVVRSLSVLRVGGRKALSLKADGQLDQQALRGVCELTPQSAALLDQVLGNVAPPVERVRSIPATTKARATVSGRHKEPRRTSKSAFATEREFERTCIERMLARWGVEYRAQHTHRYLRGSSPASLKIDYLVSDKDGLLTLFENKRRLSKLADREQAVKQARSYALELTLPSFIVAAPDGLWLYRLWHGREVFEKHCAVAELSQHDAHVLRILRDARTMHSEPPPHLGSTKPDKGSRGSRVKSRTLVLDPPPPNLEIHSPQATAVLDAMVLHAVDVRGPLSEAALRQLVRDAWGLARAGSRVQQAIGASVNRLRRRKQIRQTSAGDLIGPDRSGRQGS